MDNYIENKKYHFLLFVISPALGLIYGLKMKSKNVIRWSIFAFTVFYGSLIFPAILKGADGIHHRQNVYDHYVNLDFRIFWDELISILMFAPKAETNDDVYIHVLSYILGVFNIPGFFFTAVAIVYGYFFSGAIVKILNYVDWNLKINKFYFLYFLVLFVLWKNPVDMQTVRTWTGMWVLIYAIVSYHETKKYKYLLLALTPPFIHAAFFVMAIPIWLVLFSGFRNPRFYFIIFIISTLFSNVINESAVLNLAQQTELSQSKMQGYYADEDRAQLQNEKKNEIAQAGNFYKEYEIKRIHYQVLTGLIIFIFIFLKKNGFGVIENLLFSYGLATAAFANFVSFIFALYSRSWQIAGILILALVVIFLSKNNLTNIKFSFLKVKLPLFAFTLFLFPYMLFKLSGFLSFTSVFVFLLPILNWIEPNLAFSIRDFILFFL